MIVEADMNLYIERSTENTYRLISPSMHMFRCTGNVYVNDGITIYGGAYEDIYANASAATDAVGALQVNPPDWGTIGSGGAIGFREKFVADLSTGYAGNGAHGIQLSGVGATAAGGALQHRRAARLSRRRAQDLRGSDICGGRGAGRLKDADETPARVGGGRARDGCGLRRRQYAQGV